jgi:hypothetical protein
MYQPFPGESGSLIMPDMITMILKKFRLKYEDGPGEAALPADQYKTSREGVHWERTTAWCDPLQQGNDSEREYEVRPSEENFIISVSWQDKSKQKIASAAVNN